MDNSILDNSWFNLSVDDSLIALETTKNGLSNEEVLNRQNIFGLNKLQESKRKNRLKLFIEQFNDILIYILMAGAIISVILSINNK